MGTDGWSQVHDLDGQQLYAQLGVHPNATAIELRKAYRNLAKTCHPDRGGTAAEFARLQRAYAVLSDPRQRQVYDAWASELQFRYVPHVSAERPGGEDMLLDEFEGLGLHCNPQTQLVVTCEVCRRPATKECWICAMKICEFCTLKRHWKGAYPLHWPLINSDHMRSKLGRRELQKKCIEDDHRLMLQDPNHRTDSELATIRSFRDAAKHMLQNAKRQVTYSLGLAQFYMWAQTQQHVFLAVYLPTGYQDQHVHLECSGNSLLLQPQNSPPVIDRLLDYSLNISQAVETFKTEDNRLMLLTMHKGQQGQQWMRLFRGDPDGARCMQPLYTLTDAGDVHVDIEAERLQVSVRNTLAFSRTYWRPSDKPGRDAIEVADSMWTIDAGSAGDEYADNTIVISLAKPEVTEEERMWKKGQRQDYRSQQRPEGMYRKGYRLFSDDEDVFGLEDALQAAMYLHTGSTCVPAKPWEHDASSKFVTDQQLLSKEVQQHLAQMQQERGLGCSCA